MIEKEILYYNPKQKAVGLVVQETVKKKLTDEEWKQVQSQCVKGELNTLKDLEQKLFTTKRKTAVVKTVPGDKFDLEVAYALCVAEICAGSKRKREKTFREHFGSLLDTPEGYKACVLSPILNSTGMSYEGLKKHIRDITSDKDWEVLSKM